MAEACYRLLKWDPASDGPIIDYTPVWLTNFILNLLALLERQHQVSSPGTDDQQASPNMNGQRSPPSRMEEGGRNDLHIAQEGRGYQRKWICVCVGRRNKWILHHVEVTRANNRRHTDRTMFEQLQSDIVRKRRRHWYWHVFQPRMPKKIECCQVKQSIPWSTFDIC